MDPALGASRDDHWLKAQKYGPFCVFKCLNNKALFPSVVCTVIILLQQRCQSAPDFSFLMKLFILSLFFNCYFQLSFQYISNAVIHLCTKQAAKVKIRIKR